jgi:hypothetical protein
MRDRVPNRIDWIGWRMPWDELAGRWRIYDPKQGVARLLERIVASV